MSKAEELPRVQRRKSSRSQGEEYEQRETKARVGRDAIREQSQNRSIKADVIRDGRTKHRESQDRRMKDEGLP
jgi:hypothetical protein